MARFAQKKSDVMCRVADLIRRLKHTRGFISVEDCDILNRIEEDIIKLESEYADIVDAFMANKFHIHNTKVRRMKEDATRPYQWANR